VEYYPIKINQDQSRYIYFDETICHIVEQKNVDAFADVIEWIQTNISVETRVQIVRFLMVMLIDNKRLSLILVTILRFLGDIFLLFSTSVEDIFLNLFDVTLPPMPRPDLVNFWESQNGIPRFKEKPSIIRMKHSVFQPELFDLLGAHEHRLLDAHFERENT